MKPSGQKTCLALDVSGSMSSPMGNLPLSCYMGAGAMAMVTARTEPQHYMMAFSQDFVPLAISKTETLQSVMRILQGFPHQGTDCAVPMIDALKRGLEVEKFIIYTDNQTWYGDIHPKQALDKYREKMGIPAKLVVVGMTANEFTIADPDDAGMLDVVGFDTNTPQIIAEF